MNYVKPYKKYFILGPLCMIVEVVGEILMPLGMAKIINQGVENQNIAYIIIAAILMILCALMMMTGGVGGAYFGAKASVNFAADLRKDVFSKIQTFSFANIDRFSTGSLITRMTNDVTQLQNFVNMLLRMFLRSPGMLIGAIIMSIKLRPDLAVVLAITIPCMLLVQFFVIRRGFPLFRNMQKKIDTLNTTVQENLTNIRVVKSFVREDFEQKKFENATDDLKASGLKALYNMITMMPLLMLFMNLSSLAVLWFGGNMVAYEGMPVGDLSAFITYITQILMSLMMVSMMFMTSSRALASAKRISEVMAEEVDINDDHATQKEKKVILGKIEFKNVSFRYYKNSEEKVLNNINLTIDPGQTVGIIGSTGSGKTTLVSMIPRLYDVDEGEILVDGINVKEYSLENLRNGVGMVLQKNVLFSGTIEENLAWGCDDSDISSMQTAADHAQAHEFIERFKDGYQTVLEQGGSNVSGGQKQRLCIARALLKKPKILILDDSTSAVDTATETKIRAAFKDELKNSIKIVIAQRISSVMESDLIVVMDDGVITGTGTHNELLETNEAYKEIYASQMENKEGGDK
ncbi:MAG: ABC transporter ATP-binding protein [Clostridia bacterium]|nr:ABC transporter ATP-binding protein [Clostridia bacterium]